MAQNNNDGIFRPYLDSFGSSSSNNGHNRHKNPSGNLPTLIPTTPKSLISSPSFANSNFNSSPNQSGPENFTFTATAAANQSNNNNLQTVTPTFKSQQNLTQQNLQNLREYYQSMCMSELIAPIGVQNANANASINITGWQNQIGDQKIKGGGKMVVKKEKERLHRLPSYTRRIGKMSKNSVSLQNKLPTLTSSHPCTHNHKHEHETNHSSNLVMQISDAITREAKIRAKSTDPENMYIECPVCQKKIKRLYHFQRHMKIHSGEKQHKCPYCPYKSVRKDNLNSHLRTHEKHRKEAQSFSHGAQLSQVINGLGGSMGGPGTFGSSTLATGQQNSSNSVQNLSVQNPKLEDQLKQAQLQLILNNYLQLLQAQYVQQQQQVNYDKNLNLMTVYQNLLSTTLQNQNSSLDQNQNPETALQTYINACSLLINYQNENANASANVNAKNNDGLAAIKIENDENQDEIVNIEGTPLL